MTKITSIEDGVKRLFSIRRQPVPSFSLVGRKSEEYIDTLIWEGKRIPLFDTHFDVRVRNISDYGKDAEQNSALNVYSYVGNDIALSQLIYNELDIAEFILHSKMKSITAFVNQNAANIIVLMENGSSANLDLGNTMAAGSKNQCQHRLITKHGMANDRAVGDMIVQHQVNLYTEENISPVVYDDDEYYLYGLDEEQVRKVFAIYGIMTGNESCDDWGLNDIRYCAAVDAVYESNRQGRTIELTEVLERSDRCETD